MAASARITPAPLPSLTAALSRRAALFGSVAATGFLGAAARANVAPLPALATADAPIAALYERYNALIDQGTALFLAEDRGADAAFQAARGLQEEAFLLRPASLPDAVAALAWARHEFAGCYVEDGHEVDWPDRWTLAMIDGALALLRGQVAGAAV